nr:hypothetical protein [candidate division Zixibacteria bacterium]
MNNQNLDLNAILIKPIYISLAMNVFVPVIFLLVAYYVDHPDLSHRGLEIAQLPILLWVLVAVSLGDIGMAVFLKRKLFFSPMIYSRETFVEDLARRTLTITIICTALTTAISVYGLVYYFIGGTFDHLLLFVFVSFIAYQLIRPRHGYMKKVVEAQERLMEEEKYYRPKP